MSTYQVIILVILLFFVVYWISKKADDSLKQKKPAQGARNVKPAPVVQPVIDYDDNGVLTLNLHSDMSRAEWDDVRRKLQKIAYGIVNESQEEKDKFTLLMKKFASVDPLYQEVMSKLVPVILENKGMLQSKIYQHLPNYDQEAIRYVLYFAHEIGDILRVKKGRSYELFVGDVFEQ